MPLIRKDPPNEDPPRAASRELLARGTPQQRWSAARDLGGTAAEVAELSSALLREADPRVREAILTSLAKAAIPAAVDAVMPHLRSDDASLRTAALDALRAMPAAVAPRLRALLHDRDPDVRILACELVRHLPDSKASSLLAEILGSEPDVNVCAAAVEVLAEVGRQEDIGPLSACAERFRDASFLRYAIEVTVERISGGAAPPPHG